MSDHLLALPHAIKESTLSYIKTAYRTNNSAFNETRDDLLRSGDISRNVFGESIFELIPRYASSKQPVLKILTDAFEDSSGYSTASTDIFLDGVKLFEDEINYEPYQHQLDAVRETLVNKNDVVVTTGTGSGKSLCFILPLITNLVMESSGSGGRPRWSSVESSTDWWKSGSSQYSYNRGSGRTAAVRGMVMYPLNALVRDQIETLRSLLDCKAAESYYSDHLDGDRIYFGQYVGATPGKGNPTNRKRLSQARDFLRGTSKRHEQAIRDSSDDLWKFVENPAGSQMMLRWDMQQYWPDILITNFTMLSIMMVRDREAGLFDSTKQWLRESEENVFFLVLDELHTYRGTPGTEISHTIKLFLERLGLYPGHPQLRIIATSASLEDESGSGSGEQFLEDFFGMRRGGSQFTLIDGEKCVSDLADFTALTDTAEAGRSLARFNESDIDVDELEVSLRRWCDSVPTKPGETPLENVLWTIQEELKRRADRGHKLGPVPFACSSVDSLLFPDNPGGGEGLVKYFVSEETGLYVDLDAKLRLHHFTKILPGLRQAMIPSEGHLSVDAPIYDQNTKFCPSTGLMTLDTMYCQVCGEIYYRAYRRSSSGEGGVGGLEISNEPDRSRQTTSEIYVHQAEQSDEVPARWTRGYLLTAMQRISPSLTDSVRGSEVTVNFREVEADTPPSGCISCGTDWSSRGDGIKSPIRTMGTGYYRFSQILVEQLYRYLAPAEKDGTVPSCIAFSDSRRDASRFSAEMERNHYRDTLRALSEEVIGSFSEVLHLKEKYIDAFHVGDEAAKKSASELLPKEEYKAIFIDAEFERLPVEELRSRHLQPSVSFSQLSAAVEVYLLDSYVPFDGLGIETQRKVIPKLKSFYKPSGSRDERDDERLRRAENLLRRNIREVITDSLGRDFESLGFGWLTVDRSAPLPSGVPAEQRDDFYTFIDMVLRFLSFYYRTRHKDEVGLDSFVFPNYFYQVIADNAVAARVVGAEVLEDNSRIFEKVRDYLQHYSVADEYLRILIDGLYIHLPGSHFWECDNCRSIHMFQADGQCRTIKHRQRCSGELKENPIDLLSERSNYYKEFREEGRYKYPIRTAEIIGHTPAEEQRNRQLAFQGKFLDQDISGPVANALKLDLLSVTTTMEAGVDIGGLKSVFLAGMPPRRFNYQQRVGRAGRRRDRLSVALTFCKGQKHDEYYFDRPELMLAEKTASPKLDSENIEILVRVVTKWFMNWHVNEVYSQDDFQYDGGGENSGKLGSIEVFQGKVETWLDAMSSAEVELREISQKLSGTQDEALVSHMIGLCIARLEQAGRDSEIWCQKYGSGYSLSEVLVKEGYFPLYGMPERDVSLLTEDPNTGSNERDWPITEGLVSRSEDIAIAEFAPGQEYLIDKRRYKSSAIGWLEKNGRDISAVPPPQHMQRVLYICGRCSNVSDHAEETCRSCGSDQIALFSAKRPKYYVPESAVGYRGYVDSEPQSIITTPAPEVRGNGEAQHIFGAGAVSSLVGNVLRINANSGLGYQVAAIPESSAAESVSGVTHLASSTEPPTREISAYALYSEQYTSLLQITLSSAPEYIKSGEYDATSLGILNAAHGSLAELIKMGIVLIEDIEPNEMTASVQREENWGIYIADTLDNGSGYSTKYSRPENFSELLGYIETNIFEGYLTHHDHDVSCVSSCYRCLRNYENRLLHESLDWRLAIDLLEIYKGNHVERIEFGRHWRSVVERSSQIIGNLNRVPVVLDWKESGPVLRFESQGSAWAVLLTHPLMPMGQELIETLLQIKDTSGVDMCSSINPYLLLRDPVGEATRCSNARV